MPAPRRNVCLMALLLGLGLMIHGAGWPAQTAASEQALEIELRDLLNTGLRTRLPSEKEFVDRVVGLVQAKKLPLEVVIGTFLWARHRQPYPYPYFERALRLRAARRGIAI